MHLGNPLPVFIGITLMACVCGWMSRSISVLDEVSSAHAKTLPLDGLRGILASSVFFHHAYITYGFFRTGGWTTPASNFYAQLGPTAVTLFFFISGYLFWRKMLKAPSSVSMPILLPNRLRRIMPAYLGAVALLFALVAVISRCHLQQSPARVAIEILSWLLSGFPVMAGPHLNSFETKPLTGGIYWTLQMEWLFYLLLPALVWFRPLGKMLLLPASAILIEQGLYHFAPATEPRPALQALLFAFVHMFWTGFFIGMLSAYANFHNPSARTGSLGPVLRSPWMTLLAAILITVQLTLVPPGSWVGLLLLAPIFFMVVAGNSFLGLLNSRPFRSLGAVSYSVYVFHGILLHSIMMTIHHFHPLTLLSPLEYWICIMPVAILVALWSTLSFRYIEKPFFFPRPVL